MLIRRYSSMFDSPQYSRIRLPRSPSEMRLAEEEADQISLFNSRTPSPTCENLANHFDQVCLTQRRVPCFRPFYLSILLMSFWLFASVTLLAAEIWLQNEHNFLSSNISDERRLKFLIRFARFHYHIPVSSREWDESANHLIERYEDEVFSPSTRMWKFSNAFLFVFSLLTTIGNIPGAQHMRLSDNGRLVVLLWSPFGICLYYYCIWILSLVLYKLPIEWQLCLLLSSVMLVVGRTFFLLLSRSFTANHAYTFIFTLLNIGSGESDRLFSIPSLLALHAIFWCFVMLALRHILDWRSQLYVRIIRAQPLRQLLCNIRARQRVSATDLIHYYRKKNILNNLHCYLLTDIDKSLIDMAIDDLKNCPHQQQAAGIT
uniref:Potassium channel domain-containing protein n=3 Tax=Parascaris univalens TaxID=6257 RepID=A0A915BFZ5_PARUN